MHSQNVASIEDGVNLIVSQMSCPSDCNLNAPLIRAACNCHCALIDGSHIFLGRNDSISTQNKQNKILTLPMALTHILKKCQ